MIALFAVGAAGQRRAVELAARLGPPAVLADGPVKPALHRSWPELDAAVFFLSAGATVRLIAPLLRDAHTDPGVVCVDEAGQFAIALTRGRGGSGSALAEQVASVLGCTPVVTDATDAAGSSPLDELVELLDATVDGDLVACALAVADGATVRLLNPLGFPLPALPDNVITSAETTLRPEWTVVVDDRIAEPVETGRPDQVVRLIPRTLVVGVGASQAVTTTAVTTVLAALADRHRLDLRAVRAFATIEAKAAERGILEAVEDHGFWVGDTTPLLDYPADTLAAVEVPNPSDTALAEVGTPSVAEAAALRGAQDLADGAPVELVAPKTKGGQVTVAAARIRPRGRLALVGLGPGPADLRTPRAEAELRRAAVVVGPDRCLDQISHLLRPGTRRCPGAQDALVPQAVEFAEAGLAVALVGSTPHSGDSILPRTSNRIEVVEIPGVTNQVNFAESTAGIQSNVSAMRRE